MARRNCLRTLLFVAGLLVIGVAYSDERILSYHSEIAVATDGKMTVAETISVRVEGVNIRRGIFRDFPTRYKDALGNRYMVEFDVLDVTRDGSPEKWRTKSVSNGVRVYVGDADILLRNDDYSYTIRYRTDRQIGYFDDHDELFWNVTGNGWDFEIDAVSATVSLPGNVLADEITMAGYTGIFGAKGTDYVADVRDGAATIRATRALSDREGLSLVLSWPKGVVAEPGVLQRFAYVLQDNRSVLLALATLLAVAAYLFTMWSRYGRDPEPGVIFPRYEPPKGYSPASARYISKMGYDNEALSAAVINLAVKGYLSITKKDDTYTLRKKPSDGSKEKLAKGEAVLLAGFFADGTEIELDQENHATLSLAISNHSEALQQDYQNIYFKKNLGLLLPSALGAIVMLGATVILGAVAPIAIGLFFLILLLHVLFGYLLQAPTTKGRLLMDELEGFRMYLEVAEKEDLGHRYPPEKTPALFERFLPFAVALGVEQAWAEQFATVFSTLEAKQGISYQPLWYSGTFSYMNLAGFADNVGGGFSSAISSAATPPGSSSGGGGGGFSGGGGGGGGGGGW